MLIEANIYEVCDVASYYDQSKLNCSFNLIFILHPTILMLLYRMRAHQRWVGGRVVDGEFYTNGMTTTMKMNDVPRSLAPLELII